MPSYRPQSVTVSSTVNGSITAVASVKLSNWDRTLAVGFVRNSASAAITNAAVNVIRLASAAGASTTLGTIYTDTKGEYAVSLPILTGTQRYRFDAYSKVI